MLACKLLFSDHANVDSLTGREAAAQSPARASACAGYLVFRARTPRRRRVRCPDQLTVDPSLSTFSGPTLPQWTAAHLVIEEVPGSFPPEQVLA